MCGQGEPLFVDVCAALQQASIFGVHVVGGRFAVVLRSSYRNRYGLSSKDFNPDMCLAVFKNLASPSPKNSFTVGITDDVTFTSLPITERTQDFIFPHLKI